MTTAKVDVEELLKRAKTILEKLTPQQIADMQFQQKVSFVSGNVGLSNPNVTPEMVAEQAVKMALLDSSTVNVVFRHIGRGTQHFVERVATAQASTGPIYDNDRVYVYTDEEGNSYVRKCEEFHDGRFEPSIRREK